MDALRERRARAQRARWWWPIVAVVVGATLLAGSLIAAENRDQAIEERLDEASSFATVGVGAVLARELTSDDVDAPLDAVEVRDLVVVLQAEVMTRPGVARVRIWSPGGVVLFSTGELGEVGTSPSGTRPIADAVAGTVVTRSIVEPFAARLGAEPAATRMWETWIPLRTADGTTSQAAVEVDQVMAVVVAGAGDDDRALASVFRWLAIAAFVTAAVVAVVTARRLRTPPEEREDAAGATRTTHETGPTDADIAIAEAAHERDISIARAVEAEERERLTRDRLEALGPLEERVNLAERRALDAERRLEEIAERVEAATERDTPGEVPAGEASDAEAAPRAGNDPSDAAARQSAELRDRLSRAAAQKAAKKRPPPER